MEEAMAATVLLQDIVDALQMRFAEWPCFLDLDTGEVHSISRDILSAAEEWEEGDPEPELDPDEQEQWAIATRIVTTDRFRQLPTDFDVHEWAIMEKFANVLPDEDIQEALLYALHGRGAFRHFKDTIRRRRVEQHWYAFRDEALKQIAIDWCEDHHIPWRESNAPRRAP
jgi:hypothetical protein